MKYDKTKVVFCDTETTGLYPELGQEIWEIAIISWSERINAWHEEFWHVLPDMSKADPIALSINKFYTRCLEGWPWEKAPVVAHDLAQLLDGKHLIGAIPSFDKLMLEHFLRANSQTLTCHYHIIDVEAMQLGWIARDHGALEATELPLPWKGEWLYDQMGIPRPPEEDRHTAMGDARAAKAVWDRMME